MAREIGVQLEEIDHIKENGRISVKDVKAYAKRLMSGARSGQILTPNPTLPDFSKHGEISRESMSSIAMATSRNMMTAWSQIPHAWLQEKIDITDIEKSRSRHKAKVKLLGGSLTITAILVKAISKALSEHPLFNVSFDERNREIIYKKYIHIGVAVDTEKGLVVPVIKNTDSKSLSQISIDLTEISVKARNKKLKAEDLEGATFTISNLGGIGASGIFPIVNYPQVAILGVASSSMESKWLGQQFAPRLMMPITLGFDHRVINGADAARFLQSIKRVLEDWFAMSL